MTTPFSSVPAAYQGAAPAWQPPAAELRSKKLYIGDPTSAYGMIEIRSPSKSTPPAATRSRGRVVHGLYGGGVAVTTSHTAARSWTYSWPTLTERDWQILTAFDDDEFGTPPWCLVEPEGVNRLTRAQSMCSGSGWTASGGAVTVSATAAPITPCGVMQWAPAAAGARLVGGSIVAGTTTPDTQHAAVNLPAEFVTLYFYASAPTGTASGHARLSGMNGDGSGFVAENSPSVTVTAGVWTQIALTCGPGTFGTLPYLVPQVIADGTASLLISNPQLSYTAQPMDWARGSGLPRVHLTTDLPRSLTVALLSGGSATFTESITGAA